MRVDQLILADLLDNTRLVPTDRNVYLWTSMLRPQSIRAIARILGVSWHTAADSCGRLAAAEWLKLEGPPYRRRPVARIPVRCQDKLAERLELLYSLAQNKGEFLMKCYLDLWVLSRDFIDNARPEFLTTPQSEYPLEFDRYYYLLALAFEFNGQQHYGVGAGYDEKTLKEIRTRDLLKAALSKEAGVRLITVTSSDLQPDLFPRLLPDDLPRRDVDTEGPYFRTLARLGTAYAVKASRLSRNR